MSALRLVAITVDGEPAEPLTSVTLFAEENLAHNAAWFAKVGYTPPWIAYLGVVDEVAVGTCAFKTAPMGGRVEIAYGTAPEYRGRGLGAAMARALIAIARATAPEVLVTACTLAEDNHSTRLLARLGFVKVEERIDPEDGAIYEWHYPRD